MVFTLLVIGIAVVYWLTLFRPVNSKDAVARPFVVSKGESVGSIASRLKKDGLIRSTLAFKFSIYRQGLTRKIQAGNFYLSPDKSTDTLAASLTSARKDEIRITIPEGYRNEQIAQLLHQEMGIDPDEFLRLAGDSQGKLFPNTYNFFPDTTAEAVYNKLIGEYEKNKSALAAQFNAAPLSETEILTLASIIERETKTEEEKPVVAGILYNRLNNNWPLQTDATLQFIRGTSSCRTSIVSCERNDWWPSPVPGDRQLASPYNTYANPGLPPAPIANPGLASIKAALSPQSTSYWFYIHGRDGKIRYAATAEEHAENIAKYLQ